MKKFSTIFYLFLIVSILVTTLILVRRKQNTGSYAKKYDEISPASQSSERQIASDQVLVKFKKEAKGKLKISSGNSKQTGIVSIDGVIAKHKVKGIEKVFPEGENSNKDDDIFQWYTITLDTPSASKKNIKPNDPEAEEVKGLVSDLADNQEIEVAEPDYVVDAFSQGALLPNDPLYSSSGTWGQSYSDLWGIKKVKPETSWTTDNTNFSEVVVAVIDTGVDRTHPDLASNMWVNAKDPINGIDDDNNGYVDDYYGWSFLHALNDTFYPTEPKDDHGHGTHIAGTIDGIGNNGKGVVGVAYNSKVKIMAIKALSVAGTGYNSIFGKALVYAADMGARVSNNSWGSNDVLGSQILKDSIKYAHTKGMVIVAATGNDHAEDALQYLPGSSNYVIAVSATEPNDVIADFSNIGDKVDVVAPGREIFSTKASVPTNCDNRLYPLDPNYCRFSGTSMAAPHVTALAAMLLARDPTLTNEQVRQMIRLGADDLGTTGKDIYYGYGRINVAKTLDFTKIPRPLAPFLSSPETGTKYSQGSIVFKGGIFSNKIKPTDPDFVSYSIEGAKESYTMKYNNQDVLYYPGVRTIGSWFTVVPTKYTKVNDGILGSIDSGTLAKNGYYTFRLTATDSLGRKFYSQIYDIKNDPCQNCIDTTGVFRPSNGLLYLKNSNQTGFADVAINYGTAGDYPVTGDWDGNGTSTIGIYRKGTFYLRNSNTVGFADLVIPYGQVGDQPVAGDWNGDGIDTIGVYRPSTGQFLLKNSNSSGNPDISFYLGNVGDIGIAGDWNGDGVDTTGVFRPSNGVIYLKNANISGFADIFLNYGLAGDLPVTGDWNGDGIDTIGVYRNAKFLLRNSNTNGFADIVFSLGNPGDMPISGNWDGKP